MWARQWGPAFAMLGGSPISSFWKIKVVRFNPSRAAAPLGPPTIQSAARNVSRIKARWASRNVSASTEVITTNLAFIGVGFKGLVSIAEKGFAGTPLSDRITALSTRF